MISRALSNDINISPKAYRQNIIKENLDNLEKEKTNYEHKINETKRKISFLMKIEFIVLYSITVFNLLFGSFTFSGIIEDTEPALISIEALAILLTFF